ncbi:MAG: sugar phosphate isomerase/epimerase [Saprospiraceae bacterium]|nr:sugar phosphate isomerase/epimerase [Saprospiraceae bacterium]
MKRRKFNHLAASGMVTPFLAGFQLSPSTSADRYVRLGGPLFAEYSGPNEWVSIVKARQYRAAYCPVQPGADDATIKAYRQAALDNDIVIAEVGAWSNIISVDDEERKKAIDKCVKSLALADQIGANCCVNISGSRNPDYWAGPHRDNLTDDTFDLIVETTRKIIDAVKPTQTYFALEPMPWAYPDSPDNYLRLVEAIDDPRFGVHMDPVNMVVSPQIYYRTGDLIKRGFKILGPHIRSCHAKDIILKQDTYSPQLEECQPGLGNLDYDVFLQEIARLKDIPLMMEHLKTAEEYAAAARYIRSVGQRNNIKI